jgi:hypothetical protein
MWLMGLAFEFVILLRGLRAGMITKYPCFYAYILCVFGVSAGLYLGFRVSPQFYQRWYWPTQYVTLVIGCGVILEILEHALESYAGARRFLRTLCIGVVAAVVCYFAVGAISGSLFSNVTSAVLERDLRAVQAVFLAIILIVVFHYRISLGRNAKGLILGLGTYVGISLMTLAIFAVLGPGYKNISGVLQSGSYLFALIVWTIALWSYAPNPVPARTGRSGPNYEQLAGETREKLEALRSHFNRTARP